MGFGGSIPSVATRKLKIAVNCKEDIMDNVTYTQIMLLPEEELTDGQKNFLSVHNEMIMAGRKAADCLIIMAKDMKRMRDEALYKEAGFATFKEYVEDALGIKERQAYNWISVLDLPPEKLQIHAGMGVTKLALIASASRTVQEEVLNSDAVETSTVKELKDRIKELEEKEAAKTAQITLFVEEKDKLRAELDVVKNEKLRSEKNNRQLANNLKHVEQELEDARKAQTDAEKVVQEQVAKVKDLEKRLSEAATPAEPQTIEVEVEKIVDNPETLKELDAAKEELRRLQEKSACSKKTTEAVAIFKANFIAMNDSFNKCLEAIADIKKNDADLAGKCIDKLLAFLDAVSNLL